MNELSAGQQNTEQPTPAKNGVEPASAPVFETLKTSRIPRSLILMGFTLLVFETIFIVLRLDKFWFSLDVRYLGIPVMLLSLIPAHFLLLFLQSKTSCKIFRFLLKGKPPVVYTNWIEVNDEALRFGLRTVRFAIIDELALTVFGNLQVKTRTLSGSPADDADLVFKFPYSVADRDAQNLLMEKIKKVRPDVQLNKRLIPPSEQNPLLKGQNLVYMGGVVFLFVVLLDFSFSTFYYIEMIKRYYLAQSNAVAGLREQAEGSLRSADMMFDHKLPFSYSTAKLTTKGASASECYQRKALALWTLGNRRDALSWIDKACEYDPNNFRTYMAKARMLTAEGRTEDAQKVLEEAKEKHKNSVLIAMYMLANKDKVSNESALKQYESIAKEFNEDIYGQEPIWPVDTKVSDFFLSEDLYFILDILLDKPTKTDTRTGVEETKK